MATEAFDDQDFSDLQAVNDFNEKQWKGSDLDLGWRYDVAQNSDEAVRIRASLRRIKDKLKLVQSSLAGDQYFKGLVSSVQKITIGMTNRYLPNLWLYFVRDEEERPQDEPQLQFAVDAKGASVSVWFESNTAVERYFKPSTDSIREKTVTLNESVFEIYLPGLQGSHTSTFKNNEWDSFIAKLSEMNYECKIGITVNLSKETLIARKENAISYIKDNLFLLVPVFEGCVPTYTKFMIVNIAWNDHGWQQPQIPAGSGFGYVKQKKMPHDTLNFKPDKPVDTEDTIYGFLQTRGQPSGLVHGKIGKRIIFFSSLFKSERRIVGLYGDAEYLIEPMEYQNPDFDENKQILNISGKKQVSLGFVKEAYLVAKPEYRNNHQMGQSGIIYVEQQNAKLILQDTIAAYKNELKNKPNDSNLKDGLEKLEGLLSRMSSVQARLGMGTQDLFDILTSKKQIIFYGPPGTGKTYQAQRLVVDFLTYNETSKSDRGI